MKDFKKTIYAVLLIFSIMAILTSCLAEQELNTEPEIKQTELIVNEQREEIENEQTTGENLENIFVEEVKEVIQGSVGQDEKIIEVKFEEKDLCVYVDFSNVDPSPITIEDLAFSRTSSITDSILELTQYNDLWETITVDFGEFGYVRNGKDNLENNGYGDYFDYANFELK